MSEEKTVDEKEETEEGIKKETPAEAQKSEEHMIPKSRFDEVNQKFRDAEKRFKALEKAAQDAETKRLQESEDYKALYEKAQGTISELQPKADGADSAHATLKEVLEAQVEAIPNNKRDLVPDELSTEQQLAWIAKNRELLGKSAQFDIGAGEQGGSGDKSVNLSSEDAAMAKKMGLSQEDYAKYSD